MAVPVVRPAVITPVVLLIVAKVPVIPQVPPADASVTVIDCPVHTPAGPVMAVGVEYTVITLVVLQPAAKVYVMVSVPGFEPTTKPVDAPMLRFTPALVQVPPGTPSVAVVAEPTQIPPDDTMADGEGLTVITVLMEQPAPTVYIMLAVPAVTPVTTPVVGFTVATPAEPLAQVPPVVASVSVMVWYWQTTVGPAMATGSGFTVITCVT